MKEKTLKDFSKIDPLHSRVKEFLKAIFGFAPNVFIEVRLIRNKKVGYRNFYKTPEELVDDLFTRKSHLLQSYNCYFSVCPRFKKSGEENAVRKLNCFWADLDAKKQTKEEIEIKIEAFEPRPSIIVDTGHGYHLYWLLSHPIPIDKNSRILCRGVLKGLSKALGGDHIIDLSRLLRVPYTLNVKKEPVPVRIVDFSPKRRYSLCELERFYEEPGVRGSGIDIEIGEIPNRFWQLLAENDKLKKTFQGSRSDLNDRSRSGHDMALASLCQKHGFKEDEIAAIIRAAPYNQAKKLTRHYLSRTIGKARATFNEDKQITIRDVKKIFCKWLYLPDSNLIDVVIATVLANKIKGADPLWMFLVAPPSGAKTEILRTLQRCKGIYYLSSLTPHTFASGKKDAKGETSLLLKIKNGILVMKDFGTILEIRRDDRAEILAQLREIADGKFDKEFGNGKVVHWEGKLGFLAGATPAIEEYLSVKQVLGERFIIYRPSHGNRMEIARRAIKNLSKEKMMREELANTMNKFLSQSGNHIQLPKCRENVQNTIIGLARVIALTRSFVSREQYGDRMVRYVPEPEVPARLSKQLYLLAGGLTITWNQKEITEKVLPILRKVALDTMPSQRAKVIKYLWETRGKWVKTKEITNEIRYPTTTTRYILEDLNLLNVVDTRLEGAISPKDARHTTPYEWHLCEEFVYLLKESKLF